MTNNALGSWLLGLSIGEIIYLVLYLSDPNTDYTAIGGILVIATIVFAIMGAVRLRKIDK